MGKDTLAVMRIQGGRVSSKPLIFEAGQSPDYTISQEAMGLILGSLRSAFQDFEV